jgi:formylglycine-generating enzyme required for sulfatase activity
MNPSDCPDPEELCHYALGLLPEERADGLEKHLQGCPACEKTIGSMERAADTMVDGLRHSLTDDQDFSDPALLAAMEKAKSLVPGGVSPAEAEDRLPVEQFGQYRLVEKLGQGGMGVVYRAMHVRLEKPVAIKILPQSEGRSAEFAVRFEHEMRAIGRLMHPNLVQAFDAGETDDKRFLFLVMELVEGQDVARLVEQQGPLPIAQACRIIRQAAVGLEYVHLQGRVHRDVKPSNLMITDAGMVKILDLGLALLDDHEVGALTGCGQAMGTPEYMAPEQAADSHDVDVRADIYSLGCTFYELLTGRSPYAGQTLMQTLMSHRQSPIPSLRCARSDVPAALDAVFRKMVAKRPEDRQPSMTAVIAELDACFDQWNAIASAESRRTWRSEEAAGRPRLAAKLRRFAIGNKVATAAVGLSLAAILAFAAVLIRIRQADNSETTLCVPDSSEVNVAKNGDINVTVNAKTGEPLARQLSGTTRPIPPLAVAPFDAQKARESQEAWATYLGVPVEMTNSIGMKLVLIPPGEFDMGSTPEERAWAAEWIRKTCDPGTQLVYLSYIPTEGPRHRVKISRPFYLGKYPVVQAEYERVMGVNPSASAGKAMASAAFVPPLPEYLKKFRERTASQVAGKDTSRHPVDTVTWNDSLAFCVRLSTMPEERKADAVYRLPTEAQWEYACRAGTTTRWYNGDDLAQFLQVGHVYSGNTTPVGEKYPNAWNLYDLYGNVYQWCADQFADGYYAQSPAVDPAGAAQGTGILRGGASNGNSSVACRSAARRLSEQGDRSLLFGFRVVCEIPTIAPPTGKGPRAK